MEMLTLAQKLEDVKILLAIIMKGWSEKKIYDPEVDEGKKLIIEGNYSTQPFLVQNGWASILCSLANLLDLTDFVRVGQDGEDRVEKTCMYGSHFSPWEIMTLCEQAEAYIALIENE